MDFCETYSPHFIHQGMNSVAHARHYLAGLLGTQRRKNMEAIGHDVTDSDYQGLEQFISSSPWDHRALMDQVACDANEMLGDEHQAGLYIDETSFLKKGHASVGVQRQWSGRAGKIENCQVGVFACLGRHDQVCMTDFRLYLPKSWTEDPARLTKAKVPENQREYKTKWQQALEMVRHARELGLKYGWVGMDSLYGSTAEFVNALEDMGEYFVGDVNRCTKVWTRQPQLEPERHQGSSVGRPRKHRHLSKSNEAEYVRIDALTKSHFERESREVKYRQGSKGELWTRVWVRTVWTWERRRDTQARERLLIVRQDRDGSFKYTLSNLPAGKSWSYYAWVQAQRFWIEHAFCEAKSQLGMAQYQVRVWKGWHHHIALTALALLFSAKLRLRMKESAPLLSVRDITELLDFYLPRRRHDEEELIANIRHRHRLRDEDLRRRQRQRTGI